MRLLTHICCGPCLLMPDRFFREQGIDATAIFYNPNIHPFSEHERRLEVAADFCEKNNIALTAIPYAPVNYFRAIAFNETKLRRLSKYSAPAANPVWRPPAALRLLRVPTGTRRPRALPDDSPSEFSLSSGVFRQPPDRCRLCYELRLNLTAEKAKREGFDAFTTSLLVSPYQLHDDLRIVGEAIAARAGVNFFYQDWRPFFGASVDLSRRLGMYRQNYCGCIFSEQERILEKRAAKDRR